LQLKLKICKMMSTMGKIFEIWWSEVIAGRSKTGSHTRHIESNLILFINNRCELLNSSNNGEIEKSNSVNWLETIKLRQISPQKQNTKFWDHMTVHCTPDSKRSSNLQNVPMPMYG
jgi:hypothetical protein